MKEKNNKLFGYLRNRRKDVPDAVEEDRTPNVRRYFKMLKRNFWKLMSLNLMMLPMIAPILVIIYLYLSFDKTPTENSVLFSQLYGANLIRQTPDSVFLLDLFGAQMDLPVFGDVGTYIGMGICVLFLAVTFGWQNVGSTYILRSIVRGEPTFLLSDYFYAVKRNLGRGFVLGLIDVLVIFLLIFDISYFNSLAGAFWMDVMFFASIVLLLLWLIMRVYLYLMQITFDLSIRKMIKNAFIFASLGIKRHLLAILAIALVTGINVALFPLFSITPLGIAIPLILPFLYYLAVTTFTVTFAAYPVIDRYMIAPFRKTDDESTDSPAPEEDGENPSSGDAE